MLFTTVNRNLIIMLLFELAKLECFFCFSSLPAYLCAFLLYIHASGICHFLFISSTIFKWKVQIGMCIASWSRKK